NTHVKVNRFCFSSPAAPPTVITFSIKRYSKKYKIYTIYAMDSVQMFVKRGTRSIFRHFSTWINGQAYHHGDRQDYAAIKSNPYQFS
ncbi:MAG: hypothetical protein ACLU1V_14485, partial [Bacteroides fragilis]